MKNEPLYQREIEKIFRKHTTGGDDYYQYLRSDKWDYAISEIEQFYHENNNINRLKIKLIRYWNKLINKLTIKQIL